MLNALCWMAGADVPWRWLPYEFLPWQAVLQQQRELQAGGFEAIGNDLRSILRLARGRNGQPTALSNASWLLQSS